jgi:hypothetical protein
MRFAMAAALIAVAAAAATSAQGEIHRPRCATEPGKPCSLYDASIVELIATPEVFDGKRVRTVGYVHFEFEGNGLYLHKEDYAHSLYLNGLWVDLAKGVSGTDCQDRYVLVEGTFRSGNRGHMGLWSGAVEEITRCMPLR